MMSVNWIEEERRHRLRRALETPGLSEAQRATLVKLDLHWARRNLTTATRFSYAKRGAQLASFLGKPFEEATRADIERFVDSLAARTPGSQNSFKIFLRSFYRALRSPNGRPPAIISWIKLKMPREPSKRPSDLLTPEEVLAIAGKTRSVRDRALVLLLYESAARKSEIIGLRNRDVHFDELGARVFLNGKTGLRPIRVIDCVPEMQAWASQNPFRDDPDGPFFVREKFSGRGKPLLSNGVKNMLTEAARLAGIRKHVHPHLFRHSRHKELSRWMSTTEREIFMGWRIGSQMTSIYANITGDDVERRILERAGKFRADHPEPVNPLAPKACIRCKAENSAASRFCSTCTMPLDQRDFRNVVKKLDEAEQKVPKLMKWLEDPRIRQVLEKIATEEQSQAATS